MASSLQVEPSDKVPRQPASLEIWLLGMVLLAGLLLESPDGATVRLRGWNGISLPEVCAARRWFGWRCPLCGATRSCLFLLQGRWSEAWVMHRLGWWCLGVIIVTGIVAILARQFTFGSRKFSEKFTYGCWAATVLLLIANRMLELCGW